MEELDRAEVLEEVQPDLHEKEAGSLIDESIDLRGVDRHFQAVVDRYSHIYFHRYVF